MTHPEYPVLVARYARYGRPMPPDQELPPEVLPGYASWIEAFVELGTDRPLGFNGVGPIPRSAIIQYTAGWPPQEADFFLRTMRALDDVYRGGAAPDGEDEETAGNEARDLFRSGMAKMRR